MTETGLAPERWRRTGGGQGRWHWAAGPLFIAAIPAAFLAAMLVWPLVAVLTRSLAGVGLGRVGEVALRSSTLSVVGFTVAQATVSTLVTLACGLPIAHVLTRYRFRGAGFVRAAVLVPFVLPTVVVASAFVQAVNRLGASVSEPTVGLAAIIGAHVFFNVAVVVRIVGGYWERADDRPRQAAAVLGAGPWRQFTSVVLPRLMPVVASAGVVVFLFSFTSFGVIRVLGGPRMATLETEIYRYGVSRGEFDVAAVLGLLQIVAVAGLAVGSMRLQQVAGRAGQGRAQFRQRQPATGWRQRLHLAAGLMLAGLLVGAPLVALVEGSLAVGDGYGLDHYWALTQDQRLLPVTPARALAHSLGFAVIAAMVAVGVGLTAAWTVVFGGRLSRGLEALSLVPLGVSAVTLGFGYLVGFAAFDLRRAVWLVPVAHAVVGLPFVLAAVIPAMRAVNPHVREAAAVLGARPLAVWRLVDWPLVRPAVLVGAGFAVAVSVGEFGATSFLSRGRDSFTAPMAVFRLISQPGSTLQGQALALSVVIGALVVAAAGGLTALAQIGGVAGVTDEAKHTASGSQPGRGEN